MPGPLEDALSRFTPSPGGLDRDELLFAVGRASVRPSRRWPIIAALLALSQALTLALLVTGTPTRPRSQPIAPPAPAAPDVSVPSAPPIAFGWRSALDEPPYSASAVDDLLPDDPPLHVSSRWDPFAP